MKWYELLKILYFYIKELQKYILKTTDKELDCCNIKCWMDSNDHTILYSYILVRFPILPLSNVIKIFLWNGFLINRLELIVFLYVDQCS